MSLLKELLVAHTGYSAWGTRQVLDACAGLTPEQLDKGLGASHSSILRTFRHIYDAERVWLRRLLAPDNELLPPGPAPEYSFEYLVQSWPQLWEGYREWLNNSSETDLTLELLTVLPDGGRFCVPRWQIVLHAINHSSFHRGQMVTMLRAFDITPPNTDMTAYYATR
jgi:uncharacterized damage-inducible protein DinB